MTKLYFLSAKGSQPTFFPRSGIFSFDLHLSYSITILIAPMYFKYAIEYMNYYSLLIDLAGGIFLSLNINMKSYRMAFDNVKGSRSNSEVRWPFKPFIKLLLWKEKTSLKQMAFIQSGVGMQTLYSTLAVGEYFKRG